MGNDGVFVVVGASRGLGFEVAKRLSARSIDLVLAARHKVALDSAVDRLSGGRARVSGRELDLTSTESVRSFVHALGDAGAPLRGLVLTAAGFSKGLLADESIDSVLEPLAATLVGPVQLIVETLNRVPLASPCDVVLVTALGATTLDTTRSSVVHIVAKAAVQVFGVTAGRELAERGIRVVSIAPGTFATPERSGIPREQLAKCIEFIIDLSASTYVESLVIRPTGL